MRNIKASEFLRYQVKLITLNLKNVNFKTFWEMIGMFLWHEDHWQDCLRLGKDKSMVVQSRSWEDLWQAGPNYPLGTIGMVLRVHDSLRGPWKYFNLNSFKIWRRNEYVNNESSLYLSASVLYLSYTNTVRKYNLCIYVYLYIYIFK